MEPEKPQKKKRRIIKKATISIDDLRKLMEDADVPIAAVEKGVGMPIHTLFKILAGKMEKTGYVRGLPRKYEIPVLKFIKNYKTAEIESKQEIKELLLENGIEVPIIVPEEAKPYLTDKKKWIDVLVKAKAEHKKLHSTE